MRIPYVRETTCPKISKMTFSVTGVFILFCLIGHSQTFFLENSEESKKDDSNLLWGKYPITASWFRDRFTRKEWDETLDAFAKQGGDTVFLRAPPIIRRTRDDLDRDLNFIWCGSYKSSNPAWGPRCYDEAVTDLKDMGLTVSAFVTYQYEENFSDAIMLCPQLDKKINSSRIYYRIVLPGKNATLSSKSPCSFSKGSEVVVLLTSFAGTDPHQLLLESAAAKKVSVYFGLPGVSQGFDADLMPAYYAWVDRILMEHKSRYTSMKGANYNKTEEPQAKVELDEELNDKVQPQRSEPEISYSHSTVDNNILEHRIASQTLYDSLHGYYGTDECCLAEISTNSPYIPLYKTLGSLVKKNGKKFAISPYVNLNKSQLNSTVQQHVQGFVDIAKTGMVDIIAVQEGRGAAKGCYYWPNQLHEPVALTDPILDKAIRYLDPTLKPNVTFAQAFSTSNQQVFAAFQVAQNQLKSSKPPIDFEFWLNVEAFEFLRDDPCLPVDPMASGMGELLNRASKDRLDRAISVAGAKVQKIISFAWDSDYTCKTNQYNKSLTEEILADLQRPIISNCSFHSYHNLSVVVLGYHLEGETQGYTVNWTDTRGNQRTTEQYGYYFELDYGESNNLVKSLEYTMLWDIPAMVTSLAPKGTVKVIAHGASEPCYYDYDLPYDVSS